MSGSQENDEEWYLWVDIDTVIIDVTFTLPFERFHGKDFITWGNSTQILAGDPLNGILPLSALPGKCESNSTIILVDRCKE